MLASARSRISDWNPQLVREVKGLWKGRNLTIAVASSLLGQLIIYLVFQGAIPSAIQSSSRYCIGVPPSDQISPAQWYNPPNNSCVADAQNNIAINWELWWLDLFTVLTLTGMIVLLVAGTYLLIDNISKEDKKGTLTFIRLTPRSVANVLVGKILGVPFLVYGVILLGLPLHFIAGMAAGIPISLIAGLDLVIIASCAFFYSIALWYGLVSKALGTFQPSLPAGVLLLFLFGVTVMGLNNTWVTNSVFDWFTLFYPGKVLPFLMGETPHSLSTINYFNVKEVMGLRWFHLPIWESASSAIALLLLNYAWWTYWVWQGLKRRFRNPNATLLSKTQSYWLTGSITVSLLGFVHSDISETISKNDFYGLFVIQCLIFLLLIAALSPQRQTLQDWARYRHQKTDHTARNLLLDLLKGESSPATGAIALNLVCNFVIVAAGVLFLHMDSDRGAVLVGLLLANTSLLIYAAIVQWILLMKTPKRSLFAGVAVTTLLFVPPIMGAILELPATVSLIISPIPAIPDSATAFFWNLFAQWVVIIGCNIQFTRQLKKAGESSSKTLLSESSSPKRISHA